MKIFVLSKLKKPLMPCHPSRARKLLRQGKALVYRMYPFTILLKDRDEGAMQPTEFKLDPGSKTTGIALVVEGKKARRVIFAANLEHRGPRIKKALDSRRAIRSFRRHRKTRYRPSRFLNRTRPKGWLAPSLQSRVDNMLSWHKKLVRFVPITSNVVETNRFDTQKMQNPEISKKEYQQGTLFGYEIREYLLEKFNRTCFYCGKKNVPLQIEHIYPKSKGGSDRISNLTIACKTSNLAKGNQTIKEFIRTKSKLTKLLEQVKAPLKDAAAMNATRYAIGNQLKNSGLPTSFWSGGRTKYNRNLQNYPKDHWMDTACVGETGEKVLISRGFKVLHIKATGRGNRQMCLVNKFGFPRTSAKSKKRVYGFQTGNQVRAEVTKGKKSGRYSGRVVIRKTGRFTITNQKVTVQGINYRDCRLLQKADGYDYRYFSLNTF